ncbi:MAG: NADP-dependent isocitrate dehydrogenase, partial [Spirochaetales bacterium]|nr:NADP-dependent isocitrate dehydrogenase [Spirochaetales bacterium]
LDKATGVFLDNNKSPSRKCGELDTRGSHFYLAMYWANELTRQNDDLELKTHFAEAAKELSANESRIVEELNGAQGKPMDIGGYYKPDEILALSAMRPSKTLNTILGTLSTQQ